MPIFAVSTCTAPLDKVIAQLTPSRGVTGYKIAEFSNFDTLCMLAVNQAKHLGLCKPGRKVIFIHGDVLGEFPERPDSDPRLKLVDVE